MFSIGLAMLRDCFGAPCGYSHYESHTRVAISRDLSENCLSYAAQSRQLRGMFAEMELARMQAVHGHTHGKSAATRSSASAFIDSYADSTGRRAVFLQGSASDVKNGREITRVHYWGKDWNVQQRQLAKQDNDVCAMVDVDYHVDMPRHLSRNFRPLILYTLQPSQAAADRGEYKYTFLETGEIDYKVSGGGHYTHKLWNWQGDSVAAERRFCGIPFTRSVFNLERKQLDEDHQLVLITPLVKFTGVRALISHMVAECNHLRRMDPIDRNFVRLAVNRDDGMMVSTAKVGGYLSATVPAAVDEAIASAAATSAKLTHAMVKSKMGKDSCHGSEVLLEYHLGGSKIKERVDALSGVRSFQWIKEYQDYEPEKPSMVPFMRPLFDGAFVPDNCKNNDQRMVEERVLKLKSSDTEVSPFLNKVIVEFCVQFRDAVGGGLRPYDMDVVYERQPKPSQRRILDEAEHTAPTGKTQVFQKAEAYGQVTDPRAISQINGCDKRDFSAFVYPVADRMKHLTWYAFGKKPREIAERVAELCSGCVSHVDSTDFSRMDGRVGPNARYLERVLMLKLYNHDYHLEMLELMKSQTFLVATTKNGVQYDTGYARASGSPETSAFNSILNAFIAYLTFRMSKRSGKYMDAKQAWLALGLYGGDDGLTPDQDGKAAEKAARMMGQVMTVERTKRGDMGVTFLARCYGPDVWWGDDNSCCDIKRQLAKFHVTTRLSSKVTPLTKLREKAYAFSLTDAETPILGWFVMRVLHHAPVTRDRYENVLGIWNSDVDKTDHYPNRFAEWMFDLALDQLPNYDLLGFSNWVENASLEDLFNCPEFVERPEPNAKDGIFVLDDDIHENGVPAVKHPASDAPVAQRTRYRGRKPKPQRGAHASQPKGKAPSGRKGKKTNFSS